MTAHVIGIDIDRGTVRAVRLGRRGGRHVPVSWSEAVVPPLPDGRPGDPLPVLRRLLRAIQGRGGNAGLGIGGGAAVLLELPDMPAREMGRAIEHELPGSLPFPVREARTAFALRGKVAGGRRRVLACAAPRASVDAAVELLEAVGVAPAAVVTRAVSIAGAVHAAAAPTGGSATAVVEVGVERSVIAIVEAEGLVFGREVDVGRRDIVRALGARVSTDLGDIDLGPEQAEAVVRRLEVDGSMPLEGPDGILDPGAIHAMIRPELERLRLEIGRSLLYYAQTSGREVGRVLVGGGGIRPEGLARVIAEEVDCPVVPFDVLAQLGGEVEGTGDLAARAGFLGAVGAAVAAAERGPANLVSKEVAARRVRGQVKALALAGLGLAIVLGIAANVHVRSERATLERAVIALRTEVEPLRQGIGLALEQNEELARIGQEVEVTRGLVEQVDAGDVAAGAILTDLSRILPDGVWVLEAEIEPRRVRLLVALTGARAAALVDEAARVLEASPFLASVSAEPEAAEGGAEALRYRYTASVVRARRTVP